MSISLDSITYPNITNLDLIGTSQANGPINNAVGNTDIPLALIIIMIIIIAYIVLFTSLGRENIVNDSNGLNNDNGSLGLFLWGLFIILILLNGMAYIFSIDIVASIKNIFSPVTTIDIKAKDNSLLSANNNGGNISGLATKKKQVFHVSDNKYNYEDAKAICSAYDARLANYNEISQAYNDGADWCGYGWSDNQMALFPTQERKWNELQKIDGHHNDCGRPGINGGFIDNPNIKFGINCYGTKPDINSMEAENMRNEQLYPKTKKEMLFDKKVEYWRTKLADVMVSPFNSDNWSVI